MGKVINQIELNEALDLFRDKKPVYAIVIDDCDCVNMWTFEEISLETLANWDCIFFTLSDK